MKNTRGKIRTMRKAAALVVAALALNLLAAVCIQAAPAAPAAGRYLAQTPAQAPEPFSPEVRPATEEQATPEVAPYTGGIAQEDPCAALRDNVQTSFSPLTTVSDTCLTAVVTEGTIALDFMPDSFSFPIKHTSSYIQESFSNDDPASRNVDIKTGPEDILTLHDYRGKGGFTVTITSTTFESSTAKIPLSSLFIATGYPDEDDFNILDPALNGAQTNGVEYAAGSKGPQDIAAPAAARGDLNSAASYPVSFDADNDGVPDIIELMSTSSGHVGRFSQALNFLLKIPPSQPAGAYQIKFTVDLIY